MTAIAVIPCYNEQSTLAEVIAGARKFCDLVIVVDDGSYDQSPAIASTSGAMTLRHPFTLGAGAALSTGLRASLRRNPDVVVTLDGDGQHLPEEIPKLIRPILQGDADVVIGSRFLGNSAEMPLLKKFGNKALSKVTSWVCGQRVTDSQSGFRAYSPKVIGQVMHQAPDYPWASELTILMVKAGFRIAEVPITTVYSRTRYRGVGVKDGVKIFYETLKSGQRETPAAVG